MKLPKITDLNFASKKVIIRMDLDVSSKENIRIKTTLPTLSHLSKNKAKTIIIGHKGRPGGLVDGKLSLHPVSQMLSELLGQDVEMVYDLIGKEACDKAGRLCEGKFMMLMNLRFDSREEANDDDFAKGLAGLADYYVNEAFGVSHRKHSSFVGIPKYIPHAAGFHFIEEVEKLTDIINKPKRPVIFIISGVKEDKLKHIEDIERFADKVLVGGRLPEFLGEVDVGRKTLVAKLNPDRQDITVHSTEAFENEIEKAKTIILAGPIGKFEDEGQRYGTKKVFEAVANSKAYKVAGGGDTQEAIKLFNLTEKFDWISVGGGATLEFLAKGTLPGIEALHN
jgi:phosphoglycerate kinase